MEKYELCENEAASGTGLADVAHVKRERMVPPPVPSCVMSPTEPEYIHMRPPSPAPSFASTAVITTGQRKQVDVGQISVRPLASLMDPDQMSMVSFSNNNIGQENSMGRFVKPCSHTPVSTASLSDGTAQPVDWRSNTKSIRQRLRYILDNSNKYQDVVFEVSGDSGSRRFEAHKLIMRIASPVFDKMFKDADNGDMQTLQRSISIRHVEPDTFQLLLTFIYTDEVNLQDLSGPEILNLLRAAKRFDVLHLYCECVQILKTCITDDVAIQLCGMSDACEDNILMSTALNHIANNAFEVFPSEGFLQLGKEIIVKLVERDDLRIDEVVLFEAIVRWAESKCMEDGIELTSKNLRSMIPELISKIRFPLMTAEAFTVNVTGTNILTSDELVEVYQYLSVQSKSKRDNLPSISFNTKPRHLQKELKHEDSSSDTNAELSRRMTHSPERGDNTTEPESETASCASTSSDNRSIRKKFRRSDSNQSNQSTKRRKTEKKELEKQTRSIRLEDLFGDASASTLELRDTEILLNKFVADCDKNAFRNGVEKIRLCNVRIEDFKRLDGRKVQFPSLKEFYLNIQIEQSINAIIGDISVDNLLFFTTERKSYSVHDLCKMQIDITVIINKVILLKISPQTNHITLNKFEGVPSYLKVLKDTSVKSLVYSHTQFPEKYFPVSLRRLVLLGTGHSIGGRFFSRFRHLKELTVISVLDKTDKKTLKLNEDVLSKDKLRNLGVGSFHIKLELPMRFYNIETLRLWLASWDSCFVEKFHQIFPKLREILFLGPMKILASPKLWKNMMKISSLEKILSWKCDWGLNTSEAYEMSKFLADRGLGENDTDFSLKRESGIWVGTKIGTNQYQDGIYTDFNYDFIYEKKEVFFKNS